MPEDEGDDDAPFPPEPGSPPPHPLDRVWFHPSELGPPPPEPATAAGGQARWGSWLIAGFCGVVATVALLAATGNLGRERALDQSSGILPAFAQLQRDRTAELVSTAGASIVAVRASTPTTPEVLGTGVALGGDRIVTSADLANGIETLSITTGTGRVLTARVVGVDPTTDLALLRAESARVPPVETGSSDDLAIGTWVLAVAASGGEDRWASQGVVSGLDVLIDRTPAPPMPGMLATDIQTPPTSGGGVLLDERGKVVAILSRAAPGHAVPIEMAREVAAQLAANGTVRHAWLGIDAVDAANRAGGGALVQAVVEGGPAHVAELQAGDVITAIGDDRVADLGDLMASVAHRRPGDPVELTVQRGDRRLRLDATLAPRP